MFSGEGDSSGDAMNSAGQFAAWALSQACSSKPNEQVDWATLAQQWIQMKDSASFVPPMIAPIAPPPPTNMPPITNSYEEKGEADMEVVKDDDVNYGDGGSSASSSNNNPNYPNTIYRIQPEWQQQAPPTAPWYSDQPQWRQEWNNWPNSNNTQGINVDEINAPPAPSMTVLKGQLTTSKPILPEPTTGGTSSTSPPPSMDSAKRKTLPAWIREGLEKMEREKQKQLEREKEIQHKSSESSTRNFSVSPERLANDIIKVRSEKSFQESDKSDEDEDYGNNDETDNTRPNSPETLSATTAAVSVVTASASVKQNVSTKSREELLEEWMLVVRRSLTEILLEVTNEEIQNVAQEMLRKAKAKASSAQVFRKSAISSITGKLGLGAYADSESDSSDSEEEENFNDRDSEDEIRETIRNRQSAFKSIAQEIEQSVWDAEQRELQQQQQQPQQPQRTSERNDDSPDVRTTKKGYDLDSGEQQPDKKNPHNGKRSRERTSRFSDAKDLKNRASAYTVMQTASTLPGSSSHSGHLIATSTISPSATTPSLISSKNHRQSGSSSGSSSDSSRDSYRRRNRHRRTTDRSYRRESSSNGGGSNRHTNSRDSSDSDDYSRRSRRYRHSYSRDRSYSRSRSRSRSRSPSSRSYSKRSKY